MAIQDNKAYAFTGEQLKDYSNRFAYAVDNKQNRVEKANNLYSPTNPTDMGSFIFRTTAGSTSIESGAAKILSVKGNTVLNNYVDSVLTMTTSFSDEEASASIDKDVWETVVYVTSTYEYSYSNNNWHYNGINVALEDYGITFSGTPTDGDTIRVEYTQPVIGTLTTATPGALHATGFNQYDSTVGYAHVKGGNLYRVAGASTATGAFATTPEGAQTTIALEDGRFTPAEDGYFFPSSPTAETLVALVWSGSMDNEPYSAYEVSTVVLPVVDKNNTALPTASYGMPSVRDVYDELDFENKQYIQRIGYYAYSAANLATVRALKTPYVYDNESIFYVLTSPIIFTLADDVSSEYIANDFGTEEFAETEAPVGATIEYGANLVDKLRNLADIQEVGDGLSLENGVLSPAIEFAQTVGDSTTEAMSQNAVTSMIYADPSNTGNNSGLKIGSKRNYTVPSYGSLAIGYRSEATGPGSIVITGYQTPYVGVPTIATGDSVIVLGGGGQTVTGANSILIGHDHYGSSITNTASGVIRIGKHRGSETYGAASIAIGHGTEASGYGAVALGGDTPGSSYNNGAKASGQEAVAIGRKTESSGKGAIAIGPYSSASSQGEMNIGSTSTSYGYNNSNYRLLTGLYDGQNVHDAATVGQAVGISESLAIAVSSWAALASSSPYTYSATVSVTATIGANSTVELLNDQPILFGTYGFAIGAADTTNNTVTIYSIGQPDASVSLNINIKG